MTWAVDFLWIQLIFGFVYANSVARLSEEGYLGSGGNSKFTGNPSPVYNGMEGHTASPDHHYNSRYSIPRPTHILSEVYDKLNSCKCNYIYLLGLWFGLCTFVGLGLEYSIIVVGLCFIQGSGLTATQRRRLPKSTEMHKHNCQHVKTTYLYALK